MIHATIRSLIGHSEVLRAFGKALRGVERGLVAWSVERSVDARTGAYASATSLRVIAT